MSKTTQSRTWTKDNETQKYQSVDTMSRELTLRKIKSVVYSSQENHTNQIEYPTDKRMTLRRENVISTILRLASCALCSETWTLILRRIAS